MADLPGRALAQELIDKSREECHRTPMEAVIQAVEEGHFGAEEALRLIIRLWTLERMFYYIYGGWGQGLEINDFPRRSNTSFRGRSWMSPPMRCCISIPCCAGDR